MFTPLLDKLAEPPPPEGVSSKEWDKILQKGQPTKMPKTAHSHDEFAVSVLRKAASDYEAQRAFEELTSSPQPTVEDELLIQTKLASIEDHDLYQTAYTVSQGEEDALAIYERLGGTYKYAFGQQMFDAQQMSGSPAVSGGMAARSSTRMPQMQSAPVSVTTTTVGQNGQQQQSTASSPTSPTSTPSAPTG